MKTLLADALYVLHILLFVPVFLAFFYKSGPWLKYNVVLIPLIMMDWHDHDRQCSLTALEAKLRGTWRPGTAEEEGAPAFFAPALNRVLKPFGVQVSRQRAGDINAVLFLSALFVSFVRYVQYEKLSLAPKTAAEKAYIAGILLLTGIYLTHHRWPLLRRKPLWWG